MELVVLTTFYEDDSLNVYERFQLTADNALVFLVQLYDQEIHHFMEEQDDEFRFLDWSNEEGWDFTKGSLELCNDIKLPKTCYEFVLVIPDKEQRRKIKRFFDTGTIFCETEGFLI